MSYRIRNWSEYNAGLKQRGSLTFWLDEAVLSTWLVATPSGARGATQTYSDVAIATIETLKAVYRQAGRQTEGLLKSLFKLMNIELPVPNHTTVSRRKGSLTVGLPVVPKSGAVHLVVDSTGIKVYGEGEWKRCDPASLCGARERAPRQTRQHGVSKRRTWRKLHLGIDEATGEILSAVVTTNDVHDSAVLQDLLASTGSELSQVSADGAYDQMGCYDTIAAHSAKAAIPPRQNAKIRQHGNCKRPPHPRDENLRVIRKRGRKTWKKLARYHRRSLAETTMFRHKAAFGGKVRSRKFENQAVEILLQCAALNRMIQIAIPVTVWIDD